LANIATSKPKQTIIFWQQLKTNKIFFRYNHQETLVVPHDMKFNQFATSSITILLWQIENALSIGIRIWPEQKNTLLLGRPMLPLLT